MESMLEPFTAELTIEPGAVIDGSAAHGFAESIVTLRATRRGALGSGTADLRWDAEPLATGISAATFMHNFWNGDSVAHADALDFGRLLLRRVLGHPNVHDRWDRIQQWRGSQPLRLELILPPAEHSPISAVPFELLADDRSFLFYAGRSALVRCIRDLEPRRAALRPRDRLVVAWANPTDIQPRVDDAIFEEHVTSLAEAGSAAQLEVPAPVGRTDLARLQDALTAHRPVPVVSLVAHGYPGGGRLALENANRTSQPVPASSIAGELQAAGTQVALLWSCHGARHHTELGSLAERLLHPAEGDLAAVLAAHGAVRASWTARAAKRLFESLTASAGNDLECAVTHARQTLTEQDPQWAALAYYARPVEGRSVTFEAAAAAAMAAMPITASRADRVRDSPRRPYYWVDRPVEVGDIVARVASRRLVTVRGMPGIGKTEIAREAADRLIADPAVQLEAALWIALDDLRTVDDLRARIAAWAGLSDPDVPDWRLAERIGTRQALWILDNAEDLIRSEGSELRAFLGSLLERCPGIRLLVTSQRPLGHLHGEREEPYFMRRIDSPDVCRELFAKAAGNTLGERIHGDEVQELLVLLDGHPRSLVLVASQVRDGGANLRSILSRLRERGDAAILAAELLESGADWDEHDRLRAERLISSLHLAYQPLRQNAPGAAELFAWLGVLPAGLPVALTSAIFGEDAPERIATLDRFSLVELRGADERLELPTPVRWYAERVLAADVATERQVELAVRTLDAIASLMAAAYTRMGKPGAGAVVEASRREGLNLESLLGLAERTFAAASSVAGPTARAFWRWSEIRIFGGHHATQIALIERALRHVTTFGLHDDDRASLIQVLGNLYLHVDRLADAENAYHKALGAFAATDERLGEANTRRALGDLYFRTDRLDDAEDAYDKALDTYTTIDDRLGEANTRKALGDVYLRTNRLADAEDAYEKALATFTAIGARLGEANTRKALGNLYLRTARLANAEHAYGNALAGFTAIDEHLGEANTRRALGDVYLRTDRLADAEDAYDKALDTYTTIDDRLGEANTRKALGDLYRRTDRLADAQDAYDKALVAFIAIDARLGEANTRLALGDLYGRIDRLADAENAYDKALDTYTTIGDRLGEANTRRALGDLYRRTDRLADAEDAYDKALDTYTTIGDRLGEAFTRRALGDLYLRTNQLADAEEAYDKALATFIAIDDRLGEAWPAMCSTSWRCRPPLPRCGPSRFPASSTRRSPISARPTGARTSLARSGHSLGPARASSCSPATTIPSWRIPRSPRSCARTAVLPPTMAASPSISAPDPGARCAVTWKSSSATAIAAIRGTTSIRRWCCITPRPTRRCRSPCRSALAWW
jgi:tetratricopeptide (TPR) repeat protein